MRIWIDPVKLAARGLSASDLAAALRANNVQSAPRQIKGNNTAINITAATDLRGIYDFRNRVVKDRKSVVKGKRVAVRVDLGGSRKIKQKKYEVNIIYYHQEQPTYDEYQL